MIPARSVVGSPPLGPEARLGLASWYMPGLSDGLGDRLLMFDNTEAASLELLRFRRGFGESPAFEAALRQRIEELQHFTHASIATARTVQRLGAHEGLALVSNRVSGRRLSEMVREARGPELAVELIRQLLPVLALMHRQGDGIAHGAISADRIIVTPEGRLVIVEHVLGSALAAMHLPADSLRAELGLAMPPGGDFVAIDGRTDVAQLAFVAVSLLLGRRIDPCEYAAGVNLLDEFEWASRPGIPAQPQLRRWLERALQLNGETFDSSQDAHLALGEFLDIDDLPPVEKAPRALRVLHPTAESSAVLPPTPMLDNPDESADFLGEEEVQSMNLSSSTARPSGVRLMSPDDVTSFFDQRRTAKAGEASALMTPVASPRELVERSVADGPFARLQKTAGVAAPSPTAVRRGNVARWLIAGVAVLAVAEGAVIAALMRERPPTSPQTVTIDSPKPGAEVLVDGRRVGVTPFKVTVGSDMRSIQVLSPEVRGAAVRAASVAAVGTSSQLEVTSDPVGARVVVDGTRRGVTPLTLQVPPGQHVVLLSQGTTTASRTVTVQSGGTATVMVALAPAGTAAGWLSFNVPIDLQVSEAGSLLGTTSAARLMLPAGHHNLELTNASLGFRTTLSVNVQAGKTVAALVAVPNGSISINASPWANVWLDGRALGTTPLANLDVPLGTHEIIWRHPQLGERRQAVVVTTKAPVRVGMDLSK